jgi:hypothetical protein
VASSFSVSSILVTSSLPMFFEASSTSKPIMRPFLSRSIMTFSESSSLMSYLAFRIQMYIASAFASYSTFTISFRVSLSSKLLLPLFYRCSFRRWL